MIEHPFERSERCSVQAGLRGDPMLGTAFPASRLLLVEQPGPWGRTGLLDSRFDKAVAHRLIARLDPQHIRVVAIRRPGRAIASGPRRWAAVDCRPGRERLVWGRFDEEDDLLRLDVGAILSQSSAPSSVAAEDPADDANGTAPLFLVCAHGNHDVCCAVRGRPVAAALELLRPGRVWECSHIGGDRFAANVLVVPSGMLYGRVVATAAQAVIDAAERGAVLEQHLRGRVGFPPDVQAAMALAHRDRPGLTIADIRPVTSRRTSPTTTVVRLLVGAATSGAVTVDVEVRVEPSSTAWLTCQASQPSHANVYQPLSLVEVGDASTTAN